MAELIIVRPIKESRINCCACGEIIPACTPRFQVRDKKGKSQGTYCPRCNEAKYPHRNAELNDDEIVDSFDVPNDTAENAFERQREDYAAYRAAGVSDETYWADRNAGYCN